MNVPLIIAVALLLGMLAFALMSRRLRNVIVDGPPPTDPTTP
jgi:hypothetical protein